MPSEYLEHGPTLKGWVPYICVTSFHLVSSLVAQFALYACVSQVQAQVQVPALARCFSEASSPGIYFYK